MLRFNKYQVEDAGDWQEKTKTDHFRKQEKDEKENSKEKKAKPNQTIQNSLTIKDHYRIQAVNNNKKGIYIRF